MISIYETLKKVGETSSRLEKEKIIKEFSCETLKMVFNMTYEPTKMFHVNKLPDIRTVDQGWSFESKQQTIFDLLLNLSNRVYTGHEALNKIAETLDGCDKSTLEIFEKIINKDMKIGVSTKTLNKIFGPTFVSEFKVQLANKYDPQKKYDTDTWNVTPKLDGLRAVYIRGLGFFSRGGKEIFGFDHIIAEIETIFKKFEDIEMLDGELYADNIGFQEIQGIVTSNVNIDPEKKQKIKYMIFAMISKSIGNTNEMSDKMREVKNICDFQYLKFLIGIDVNSCEVMVLAKVFVENNYEGAMLRHPIRHYNFDRSDDLLKLKFMMDADLTVVGFEEGEGKHIGKLGALIAKGNVDGHQIQCKIGSGFDDKTRVEIFLNQSKYIGKTVSVQYQNLTDDKISLRFPVFLGFREDK